MARGAWLAGCMWGGSWTPCVLTCKSANPRSAHCASQDSKQLQCSVRRARGPPDEAGVGWCRADAVICTEDEDVVTRVRDITGGELAYGVRLSPHARCLLAGHQQPAGCFSSSAAAYSLTLAWPSGKYVLVTV